MRGKKIAVIISYITMVVQFIAVLFVTPYILRKLGSSEYGLYQYVASAVSYLSLLGFGFSSSYIRYFSRYIEKRDDRSIASLNGMFMTVFIFIAILCLILGSALSINVRTFFGAGLEVDQYRTAQIMVVILSINMALTFPKSIFSLT